jgi:superfamily II DNA helicase RecQ
VGQQFRPASALELAAATATLAALRSAGLRSTGKLYAEICPGGQLTRDTYEEVLGALARAGLVQVADAVFEKDGRSIPYRKATLTTGGEAREDDDPLQLVMKDAAASVAKARKSKAAAKAAPVDAKVKLASKPAEATPQAEAPPSSAIEEALRKWRLAEAKRRGVPAFRIISDQALKAIAAKRPATAAELLSIPGMGISNVEKYGAQIYRLVSR